MVFTAWVNRDRKVSPGSQGRGRFVCYQYLVSLVSRRRSATTAVDLFPSRHQAAATMPGTTEGIRPATVLWRGSLLPVIITERPEGVKRQRHASVLTPGKIGWRDGCCSPRCHRRHCSWAYCGGGVLRSDFAGWFWTSGLSQTTAALPGRHHGPTKRRTH